MFISLARTSCADLNIISRLWSEIRHKSLSAITGPSCFRLTGRGRA